jgi:hypothetical protein
VATAPVQISGLVQNLQIHLQVPLQVPLQVQVQVQVQVWLSAGSTRKSTRGRLDHVLGLRGTGRNHGYVEIRAYRA